MLLIEWIATLRSCFFFRMCFALTNVWPAVKPLLLKNTKVFAQANRYFIFHRWLLLFVLFGCLAVCQESSLLAKMPTKNKHFPDTSCFWLELHWCSHASLLPVPPGRLIRGEQSCSTIKTASCVSRHLVESLAWRTLYLLPRTWPPIELTERHDIT